MLRIPSALQHDTIYECVFEVRFAPGNSSMEELMPGMLYSALGSHFKTLQPLPIAQLPKEMRGLDPNLQYAPSQALLGESCDLLFGQRVVSLSFRRPYRGWAKVKPVILECIEKVISTKLPGEPERCSLKYVNVLTSGTDENDITQLKTTLSLADFTLNRAGIIIKADVEKNGCQNVIQIMSGATITINRPPSLITATGTLVSVDTVKTGPFAAFASDLPLLLETVHTTEKEVFFGLVEPKTLEKLGPSYDPVH